MPLTRSTSKQAFQSNVKAEVAAGKPPKQAVAIAFSEKRAAGGDDKYPVKNHARARRGKGM